MVMANLIKDKPSEVSRIPRLNQLSVEQFREEAQNEVDALNSVK